MSDIQFVEVDTQKIENEMIESYEEETGETLYPGDEKRIFLMNQLPIIVGLKNNINDTGRQNLLRYARDKVLDAFGEAVATPRLSAKKAEVTLRFTLSAVQLNTVTVYAGTRVTPDGKLYFATQTDLIISPGETFGDVKAEAVETGLQYNDFLPGQIKYIVDPVAFVASVTNIDTSSVGADVETDDDYRERIRLAPESFSVAGPELAYKYWARKADESISDVSVTSPSPGVVKIVVLLENGGIPNQTILDKVNAEVSPKNRRPLTDNVVVAAPTLVQYDIDLTYYINIERQTEESKIRDAIEDEGGAIDQYIAWQQAKLEREINPDELRRLMLEKGAYRIILNSPTFTTVGADQVAKLNLKTVTYGGLI